MISNKNIKRILVASGSFKDVFTPQEACNMIKDILLNIMGEIVEIELQPLVDGGECSSEVLSESIGYKKIIVGDIIDPAGYLHESEYLQMNTNTAFIATSSTMALPSKHGDELRNPLLLTSYGLGQLIRHVHERSIKNIVIGFGGTSTVDAGIGMLQALGATIYDKNDKPLTPSRGNYFTGADLGNVGRVDCEKIRQTYSDVSIKALCDGLISINNIEIPTSLKVGKYYDKERSGIVQYLQTALIQFSLMLEKQEFIRIAIENWPGHGKLADKDFFGVAGGILMSMVSIFNVTPILGIDYFIEELKINEKVARADIIISGEGRFDNTLAGKTPSGIARIAQKQKKEFVCLCGTVDDTLKSCFSSCISTNLPEEIKQAGINTIISCHAEYEEELRDVNYLEEIAYYREKTPKILQKALAKLFSKNDIKNLK